MNPTTTPDATARDPETPPHAGRPVHAFDSLPEFVVRLPVGAAVGLALAERDAVLAYFETPQRVFVCAVATALDAPQWSGASGLDGGTALSLLSDWFQSLGWRSFRFADSPPAGVDAASLPLDRAFFRERAGGRRGLCRQA